MIYQPMTIGLLEYIAEMQARTSKEFRFRVYGLLIDHARKAVKS